MSHSPRSGWIPSCLAVVLGLFPGSVGSATPAWGWGDIAGGVKTDHFSVLVVAAQRETVG